MILFHLLPLLTFSFLNYSDCFTWGGGVTACMNKSKDNLWEAALSTVWVPRLDSDHQAWCHTPLPTEQHLAGPTVYFILITKYFKLICHCGSSKACPFLLVLSLPFIRLKEPQQKLNTEIPKDHVQHFSKSYPRRQKANIKIQYEAFSPLNRHH